jgi:hypothetical protein
VIRAGSRQPTPREEAPETSCVRRQCQEKRPGEGRSGHLDGDLEDRAPRQQGVNAHLSGAPPAVTTSDLRWRSTSPATRKKEELPVAVQTPCSRVRTKRRPELDAQGWWPARRSEAGRDEHRDGTSKHDADRHHRCHHGERAKDLAGQRLAAWRSPRAAREHRDERGRQHPSPSRFCSGSGSGRP